MYLKNQFRDMNFLKCMEDSKSLDQQGEKFFVLGMQEKGKNTKEAVFISRLVPFVLVPEITTCKKTELYNVITWNDVPSF